MATTMSAFLTGIRERLRETSASTWTDTQLRRYAMEACREVARRTKCFEKTTTVSVSANTRTYTAPTDMLIDGLKGAYYTPTGQSQLYPVEYRDIKSLDHLWLMNQAIDTSAMPTMMTIWGVVPTASIILYPVPTTAGTLTLYYYRLPTDYWAPSYAAASDASNSIDIPEGYIDLVYDGAEYMALRNDRDARWQEAKALFDDKLQQMIYDAGSHSREPQFLTPYRGPMPPWGNGYGMGAPRYW